MRTVGKVRDIGRDQVDFISAGKQPRFIEGNDDPGDCQLVLDSKLLDVLSDPELRIVLIRGGARCHRDGQHSWSERLDLLIYCAPNYSDRRTQYRQTGDDTRKSA